MLQYINPGRVNQIDTEAAAGEEKDYTIGNKTPVRGACGRFATDSVFEQKKDRCAFQQSIDGEILVEKRVGCTVMKGNNDLVVHYIDNLSARTYACDETANMEKCFALGTKVIKG